MLLSIQFPFADSRAFLDGKSQLLSRPVWPSVAPDIDFVRSFGSIRKRKLGGLANWVGENAICEANRALRFSIYPRFYDTDSSLNFPLKVAFRRLYFDGQAVGKFEVGVTTEERHTKALTRKQTKDLVNQFLNLPVTVPAMSPKAVTAEHAGNAVSVELGHAGKALARFYAAASVSHPPPIQLENWWVLSGTPLLFLVHKNTEQIQIPFRGQLIPPMWEMATDLFYSEVPYAGTNLRMWVLGLKGYWNYRDVRALRICLLRLHAEQESLRLVLRNIAANKIDIKPRSNESSTLQHYLNEATRRISRLTSEANHLSEGDLAEVARASQDFINPGERESLLDTLKILDVRKNIFYKVEDFVRTAIHVEELFMGDQYNVNDSQVAAVGPNAHVYDNIFQSWKNSGGDMNLENLAKDLATLRVELKKRATSAEEDATAGEIAAAEIAAKKGEGPTVFARLKSAGQWALDVAKSIGVPVAIEALKKAIGM